MNQEGTLVVDQPRRGRPRKALRQARTYRVIVSLTEVEYQQLKHRVSHEAHLVEAGSSARSHQGSMAGLIRLCLFDPRTGLASLATVEQEQVLIRLANLGNTLRTLSDQAETAGFLPVAVQVKGYLTQIDELLDQAGGISTKFG